VRIGEAEVSKIGVGLSLMDPLPGVVPNYQFRHLNGSQVPRLIIEKFDMRITYVVSCLGDQALFSRVRED
jgi:hypothetical protein